MDQGSYDESTLNRYLKGTNFPASKKEVASNAESNGATQELVSQIRDAGRAEARQNLVLADPEALDSAGHNHGQQRCQQHYLPHLMNLLTEMFLHALYCAFTALRTTQQLLAISRRRATRGAQQRR